MELGSTANKARTASASPLGQVIIDLSRELDMAGAAHAFQRGARDLPALRPGGDVDMVVRARDLALFSRTLEQVCSEHGARVRSRHRVADLLQHHLHIRTEDGSHHLVDLDVHVSETCFGVPFLGSDELLGDTRDARGLPQADAAAGAWADVLGAHLVGGRVRSSYRRALHALRNDAGTLALGARLFGQARAERILSCLEHPDAMRAGHSADRFALLRRSFMRAPLASLSGFMRLVWATRVRPLYRPRGLTVAFLGTDGAGKTTVLERVRERLDPCFRSSESGVIKLRPGLIPQLDRLVHMGRVTQDLSDWSQPHRAAPSGRLMSNLRVLYYGLDYTIGYWARILPRRRRNSLLLLDRWFDDYHVDPLRFRVRPDTLAVRMLSGLVPRPDAVIVVTARPELVQARKQELTERESARQVAAYEALATGGAHYHLIRNEGTVEQAVDAVLDALLGGAA
ncbi:MAG: hypothetical protein ACI8QZ_002118 [Chlamydiales bacterium]